MVKPYLKHFQVIGRETPNDKQPNPTVYKFEVFAPNFVVAKSRFWRCMRDHHGIKSTKGDVLSVKIVKDKKLAARNYAVDLVYYSQRCGYTHMVKEFRDVCKAGAVCAAYSDLASKHRARADTIEILGVKSVPNSAVRKQYNRQFHSTKLSFPALQRRKKSVRKERAIFVKKNTNRAVVA